MNSAALFVRPVEPGDFGPWRTLWDGYNAFYGRAGETALDEAITQQTWNRFFVASDPVNAFVAIQDQQLVGLVHTVYHPSTSRLNDVCYLQDLFTSETVRGQGVGRALIQWVYSDATAMGCSRVYWTTFDHNITARRLDDQVASHQGAIVYVREMPP